MIDDDGGLDNNTHMIEILDKTLPKISEVKVINITENSVTITWKSDENSKFYVEYGNTIEFGNFTPFNHSLVIIHSVTIKNLESGSKYYFRIISFDESGNNAISENYSLKTAEKLNPGKSIFEISLDINNNEPRVGVENIITVKIRNNLEISIIVDIILTIDGKEQKTHKSQKIEAVKTLELNYPWIANGVGKHIIKIIVKEKDIELQNYTKEINVEKGNGGDSKNEGFGVIYIVPIIIVVVLIIGFIIFKMKSNPPNIPKQPQQNQLQNEPQQNQFQNQLQQNQCQNQLQQNQCQNQLQQNQSQNARQQNQLQNEPQQIPDEQENNTSSNLPKNSPAEPQDKID